MSEIQKILPWVESIPYLGVLIRTGKRDQNHNCKDMAASIAYFTLLSLFPILLGVFVIAGQFLKSDSARDRLEAWVSDLLPETSNFVMRNIETLVELRCAAGLVGIILLIWSGKKMVAAISRGINRALGFKRPYAFYLSSVRNFGLTLIVLLLVILSTAIAPVVEILNKLKPEFVTSSSGVFLDLITSYAAGLSATGLMLTVLYTLIPFHRIPFRELIPGIVFGAVTLECGKRLFSHYVGSTSPYDAVYGSISSVIALVIWLYFSARVLLYGAELIAVIREGAQQKNSS